jgi:TRAP-type C4-dicarboxylate transport system permease small subunit
MNAGSILLILLFAILMVIVGPIATIWSLNTLFPVLNIPFTLDTWMAAFLLFAGVSGVRFGKK